MKASRLSSNIISGLPPTIIETILCLLPIQEAVRTSVLSKEWRYSWTKIPKLVFDECKFKVSTEENRLSVMEQTFHNLSERKTMSNKCKFFYAIYQVLLLHQGPILEFTLSMHGANYGCVEIDQIITHLSRKNTVKKLTLDLTNSYRLPLSIFSLQQLTDLTLMCCEIDHQPPSNGFASLTSLCLLGIDITKKTYLDLISSCPLLKSFELYATDHYDFLGNDGEGATYIELLKCLYVVEQLTLSHDGVKFKSFAETVLPRELPTLLVHLKSVCLEHMSFYDKYWLRFLALLMRSSPNLEKIKILTRGIDSIALEDFSDIWLEHLNEFVSRFGYMKRNLELVKFILANSPLLKKVRITLTGWVSKDEELNICKILLRSPRASPLVDIIVERGGIW